MKSLKITLSFFLLCILFMNIPLKGDKIKAFQALMWNSKGIQHSKKDEHSAAITCFRKAVGLNPGKIDYWTNLASENVLDKRFDEAFLVINEALKTFSKKKNIATLEVLRAEVYLWWGNYLHRHDRALAIKKYKSALPIIKEHEPDRTSEVFNNIGYMYYLSGENQKALYYLQKALKIESTSGDSYGKGYILNNIGIIYDFIGEYSKSLEHHTKALSIRMAINDKSGIASTLNNMAKIYVSLGHHKKAMGYLKKALPISREISHKVIEAKILHNIGVIMNLDNEVGNLKEALEYCIDALKIQIKIGDPQGESESLKSIGLLYYSLGKIQTACQYFEKALPVARTAKDQDVEALTFISLMTLWKELEQTRLAILLGKISVNLVQNLRANISGFEKETQKLYLESNKDIYRKLSDTLMVLGRLSEARQVLDLHKEDEFFNYTRKERFPSMSLFSQVDFTGFEQEWFNKLNRLLKNIAEINREYLVLKFKKKRNTTEELRIKKLELKLSNAQKAYEEFLIKLKAAYEKYERDKKAEKEDVAALEKKATALQDSLKYLDVNEGGKNAALHYLVYAGRISAIITIPGYRPLLKQWEVDEKELNKAVINYVTFISKSIENVKGVQLVETTSDSEENHQREIINETLKYNKKLYDFAFKPVDEELKKYGITNLTISLDGVLRYIPLGALWDGKNYLIQRYRMVLITPTSLKNIKDAPMKEKKILGFGASRGGDGFSPLPNVGREIRSIVKEEKKGYFGLIEGKGFINDEFTRDAMLSYLKTGSYPIVHISSHFKFSPGDETKNKLLLGDGNTISLSEIRRERKLFNGVKLLVLSACETGVGGNGEEIDGFGELAQQSGAKSVIASLWPVADESTKDLMVAFYRNLKERKVTSKIEALRQAQLELAGLDDLLSKNKKGTRKKTKYSHPYYWGPFIMIGNWR